MRLLTIICCASIWSAGSVIGSIQLGVIGLIGSFFFIGLGFWLCYRYGTKAAELEADYSRTEAEYERLRIGRRLSGN